MLDSARPVGLWAQGALPGWPPHPLGNEIPLPVKGAFEVQPGDIISIRTPGGGGFASQRIVEVNRYRYVSILLCMIIALSSCTPSTPQAQSSTPQVQAVTLAETTTPVVLADTFFSGRAYVDLNGNRRLDSDDPPLAGAHFSVMGFGSLTDETGYAWALIPGGWDKPAAAKMSPAEGSGYTLIGPDEVTLQSGAQTSADFLFTPPPTPSPTRTPLTPNPTPTQPGPATSTSVAPTLPTKTPVISQPGAVRRNITYCTAPDGTKLLMDVYPPQTSAGPAPVVVYVHGGGWESGSKDDEITKTFFGELTQRGYLAVSLQYRFAPKYKFPAQIEDVKCAIRHLRANAAEYNLDPDHIGAFGGSAGGHLVALLGVTDPSLGWDSGMYPDQSSRIQAVIDMYGPMDIIALFKNSSLAVGEQVFGVPNNTDPLLEKYSPLAYITPDDPPFLIMQGDSDGVVPVAQSLLLRDKLEATGVPVEFVLVKNAGHGWHPKGGEMQPALDGLVRIVADFFDQTLR
jgi:acetyl esterase/lipase